MIQISESKIETIGEILEELRKKILESIEDTEIETQIQTIENLLGIKRCKTKQSI